MRPVGDGVDRRCERSPLFRERVFDPDRHLGYDGAYDYPLCFELLQTITKHPVGDVGDRVPQRGESATRPEKDEDDGAGPAPADELAGPVEARTEFRSVRGRTR